MNNFLSFSHNFFKKNWLKTWQPYFFIFCFAFLLYGQTLFFDYTYLDDNILVDKAEVFSSLKNIGTIFSSDALFSPTRIYYRPILNVSYLLNNLLTGTSPFSYHLGNVFLHLLAVSLIFYLLRKIWRNDYLAFWFSLFFLSYPALTQAVAWIPGRNDSLLTVFILAAVLAFINFSERGQWRFLVAYFGFLFLAVLTKETAIFLPLIIIIYWLTIGRRDKLSAENKLLIIVGSVSVIFIWFLMRKLALFGGAQTSLELIINNLPSALVMAFKMSAKVILPFGLSVLPVAVDSSYIYSFIVWPLVIIALILSKHKRREYLLFGALWFFVFFLTPFIFSSGSTYFNHRLYLPLIGFIIILSEIDFIKKIDWQNKKVIIGGFLIILFFSFLTFLQSENFSNRLIFWQAAIKTSPHSAMAHVNLGSVYIDENREEDAINVFKEALVISPTGHMAHYNLGYIYLKQKKLDQAETEFKAELEVTPNYYKALLALGDIYSQKGRIQEANYYWQAAEQTN